PASMPEGGFILTFNNDDACMQIDTFQIIDKTTSEVLWASEAEDGVWDPATLPFFKVTFQWYSGTDAHLGDASPAIDAGDNSFLGAGDTVDLDGAERIIDGNGDEVPTVDLGCYEYQGPTGGSIVSFTVSDATSGSTLVTNDATVAVEIITATVEGVTIDGWLITETDVEPAGDWLPAAPTTYEIQAASGAEVTLYAWIIDSIGKVSGKSASLYYNTAAPVVSNVVINDNGNDTATATWTTDIPAEGSLTFSKVTGDTTPATVPEGALGTAHSVGFPIAAGLNYKIILTNNEIASAPIYWPQLWPIPGDANGDCRVNILDLIFIRNRLNAEVSTGDNIKADVNLDGRINILDLIYVRNRLNTMCP
ncbi:MAG TPA: dockerin type I repeat-containing protein, partial [Planctomycetota bacterium]|nr:dockerin type I repeat-containing protein [Planctomycetota bacterium]